MSSATVKLLPVRYPVYQAISELNRSFEQTMESLEHLIGLNVFRPDVLRSHQVTLEEMRALVNEELTETINLRELGNSHHYERLRLANERRREGQKAPSPTGGKHSVGRREKAVRR